MTCSGSQMESNPRRLHRLRRLNDEGRRRDVVEYHAYAKFHWAPPMLMSRLVYRLALRTAFHPNP